MKSAQDPFGIRSGSRFVMDRARHVRIDNRAVKRVAEQIAGRPEKPPAASWSADHLGEITLEPEALANYVVVLDALNFYFWGEPRWRVSDEGVTENGYWGLALALRRAIREGYPITDAGYLARIPAIDVARILRGESVIPEFSARVHNLREAGQVIERDWQGSFLRCIQSADRSAVALMNQIIARLPSFVDVRRYDGRTIPFYKRAQILVSDIAGAFDSDGQPPFDDLSVLTAFADYKVPQVLHQLGVLRYSAELEATLTAMKLIPEGSPVEVEIRAGTIVAVEQIASVLGQTTSPLPDYAVDWYIWDLGQREAAGRLPYHRTPTIAY